MADDSPGSQVDLRLYLRVLRRRRRYIVICVLIVVAAAAGVTALQTRVYQSSARLLLRPSSGGVFGNGNQGFGDAKALQNEIAVFSGTEIATEVRNRIGVAPGVAVSPEGQTDVVQVRKTSTEPATAAKVANTYARAYIDVRRRQANEGYVSAIDALQTKINQIQEQITPLDAQIAKAAPSQQEAVAAAVSSQRNALISQLVEFKNKLDELQVDSTTATGGARMLSPAVASLTPVRPRPVRNLVTALVVGLVLGLGVAFAVDHLDDTIKTSDELSEVLAPAPVIALVPTVKSWRNSSELFVASRARPSSSAAEAYRMLRTSIHFMALDRPIKTLQITSPGAREGKSTTISNLGVAFAQEGLRVLLVDCDLRRPRLHQIFEGSNTVGFTSLLIGDTPLSVALHHIRDVPGLAVLPSGQLPPNPSELLSSHRTSELFAMLRSAFDLVLIDCPPVLPVTDAAVLSRHADGTLLVATARQTTKANMRRAGELLLQVDAPILGSVLNNVGDRDAYGYAYGYGYGTYASVAPPTPLPDAADWGPDEALLESRG